LFTALVTLSGTAATAAVAHGPQLSEYTVPTLASTPTDLKPGPDGAIYFSEMTGNKIGRIDPVTKAITEYPLPRLACIPYAINGGPGNAVWFTATGCNSIGRLDLGTHKIDLFPIPTPLSYPADMKLGHDGGLWFTETTGGKVGRFDPVTHKFAEFGTGLLTGRRTSPWWPVTTACGSLSRSLTRSLGSIHIHTP
jgi:virginiamycin B lyase